jgi:hypothetical protein
MEQQHPGSKRHAVMSGALKTGLRRGGEAFLRNLPAGITPALASAGLAGTVGGLEGAVGSLPGGETLSRAVNPLVGGLVQGDFRGGLSAAATNMLTSPTLRKDLGSLANLRKAKPEEYHGGTWGAGTYPHTPTPLTAEPSKGMTLDKDSPLYPKLPEKIRERILQLNARGMGMTPQMLKQWAEEGDRPSIQALETIRTLADNARLNPTPSIFGEDMTEGDARDLFKYLSNPTQVAADVGLSADSQIWKDMGWADPYLNYNYAEDMSRSNLAARRARLEEIIRRLKQVRRMKERPNFPALYNYLKRNAAGLELPEDFNPRHLIHMDEKDYDNYHRMMMQELHTGELGLADILGQQEGYGDIREELDRIAQKRFGVNFGEADEGQQAEVDRDVYKRYVGATNSLAPNDDPSTPGYWTDHPINDAEEFIMSYIYGEQQHTPAEEQALIYGLRRAQRAMYESTKPSEHPALDTSTYRSVEGSPLREAEERAAKALASHEQLPFGEMTRSINAGYMYNPEAQGEEYQNDEYMRRRSTPLPLSEATDLGGKYFDALANERDRHERGEITDPEWYGGPEGYGTMDVTGDSGEMEEVKPVSYLDRHIIRGQDGEQYIRIDFGKAGGKGFLRLPTEDDAKYGDVFRHITGALASGHTGRAKELYQKLRGHHRGFRYNRRPVNYRWSIDPNEGAPVMHPTQQAILDRLMTARGPTEIEDIIKQIEVAKDPAVTEQFVEEAKVAAKRIAAAWENRRATTKNTKAWERHFMPKPKENAQQGVTKE